MVTSTKMTTHGSPLPELGPAELILAGDHACAAGDWMVLRGIALKIGATLPPRHQLLASEIAALIDERADRLAAGMWPHLRDVATSELVHVASVDRPKSWPDHSRG